MVDQPKMTTSVETITPDLAAHLLETANKHNRAINARHVANLARMIEKGEWLLSGQTISFDGNGRLIDGQHRLLAVVKANTPATFLVVRGVASEAFAVVDVGKKRDAGTIASLAQIPHATVTMSVARTILGLRDRKFFAGTHQYLPSELVAAARQMPIIGESAQAAGSRFNASRALFRPSVFASIWILAGQQDWPRCEEFCASLCSGLDLQEGSPVLAMRNKALNQQAGRTHSGKQADFFASMWSAWIHYKNGSRVSRILFKDPEHVFESTGGYRAVDRLLADHGLVSSPPASKSSVRTVPAPPVFSRANGVLA
jgi:hypothetical protein